VHSRGEHHRAARGQQDRGEQVVRAAGSGPGQQVGGGGGDEDQVGFLAEADVRHLVHAFPGGRRHRLAGQRGPRRRADKMQRIHGRHDPDLMPGFGKPPQELTGLIGGDPGTHAEDDAGRH